VELFTQQQYDVRCEWGAVGARRLAPHSDAVVVVDVLSFCTSVDIATSRGATVYPYAWKDESAEAFARSHGAILATPARHADTGYSLAPTSLLTIPKGTHLVLPSPNGSAVSLAIDGVPVIAGCLRNATTVAHAAPRLGRRISVIAAGERWEDGSLRPAIEDLVGAGAIIHALPGRRSPEAEVAVAAYLHVRKDISSCLECSGSGHELIARGFASDVDLAAAIDASEAVPILIEGAYAHCTAVGRSDEGRLSRGFK
jgi:2-phosphosulfolactate phosphatase